MGNNTKLWVAHLYSSDHTISCLWRFPAGNMTDALIWFLIYIYIFNSQMIIAELWFCEFGTTHCDLCGRREKCAHWATACVREVAVVYHACTGDNWQMHVNSSCPVINSSQVDPNPRAALTLRHSWATIQSFEWRIFIPLTIPFHAFGDFQLAIWQMLWFDFSFTYTYSILRWLLQSFDFASLALRTVTFAVVGKSALTGQPLVWEKWQLCI